MNLKQTTAALSGAIFRELSVQNMLRTREIGTRQRLRSRQLFTERNVLLSSLRGAFTLGEKTSIINR